MRVDWRQYPQSLEELYVNIHIEGTVTHSMVLRKDVKLMNGENKKAAVSYRAATYTKPGSEERIPFIMPPARSELTLEHGM